MSQNTKECAKCGTSKVLAMFVRNPTGTHGRMSVCAECQNHMYRLTKVCGACGVEKTLDGFYKDTAGVHGRRNDCMECMQASPHAYLWIPKGQSKRAMRRQRQHEQGE